MLALDVILFLLAFAAIWFAAKLIVNTVCSLSHLLHISAFAISFFILGLGTSLPEFFISTSAAIDHRPEIFAGTLLGATIVVFLFVIPLLSILGNGIVTNRQLKHHALVYSLFVAFLPFICAIDGTLTRSEGAIMVLAYLILFYLIELRQGFFEKAAAVSTKTKKAEFIDLLKILAGAVIIFFAAQILVGKTIQISELLHVSPFLISILILSLGTDLPETTVAIVSALKKSKSIAMGDYLGSCAANTLILGVLTLINGNFTFSDRGFYLTFILFFAGIVAFYIFARTKTNLSRKEGGVLLILYLMFIVMKVLM
jgi:cation:H+ antiporter